MTFLAFVTDWQLSKLFCLFTPTTLWWQCFILKSLLRSTISKEYVFIHLVNMNCLNTFCILQHLKCISLENCLFTVNPAIKAGRVQLPAVSDDIPIVHDIIPGLVQLLLAVWAQLHPLWGFASSHVSVLYTEDAKHMFCTQSSSVTLKYEFSYISIHSVFVSE